MNGSGTMNCPLLKEETRSLLLDYSAGRLGAAEAATLARHMESCDACRAFGLEQTAVWDSLDAWQPGPVSVDFNRRLWQRIDAAAAVPWYRRLLDSFAPARRLPALTLLIALLVLAGGFLLDHKGAEPAASNPVVHGVSMTEVDQLEQTLDDIQLLRQSDPAPPPNGVSRQM